MNPKYLWFLLTVLSGAPAANVAVGDAGSPLMRNDDWKPAAGPLMTRWAKDVSPDKVWPEYPRPQMVRDRWTNLNGLWQYAPAKANEPPPAGKELQQRILVPFPIESALSGVMQSHERLWYRRTFERPAARAGERVLLHFGAVDWETVIHVNGKKIGEHRGGYDPFSFDITDALTANGPQELIVGVFDPADAGDQPRGKQVRKPEGIWYTPTTGIWQTVWLEIVPAAYIADLSLTPDVDNKTLRCTVQTAGPAENVEVRATALDGKEEAGTATGKAGTELRLPLKNLKLWSPDQPFLYDLKIELLQNGKSLDTVTSYFGMRKIEMAKDAAGVNRLFLNGRPLLQVGPLDQGFWPDGLYTAPTDAALRYDIEITKQLGFNMARKHVKVEPQRWYYWADKLGLLVWQDMPSGNNKTPESKQQFERELERMIATHRNHPSIIMWVVFNEGWGQYDTERVTAWTKQLDPSRLANNASGWTDKNVGDVIDIHSYPDPNAPKTEAKRAAVLGEFGGLGLAVPNHMWKAEHWGYQGMKDAAHLTRRYEKMLQRTYELAEKAGLCAAVYTQTTDVEIECNGLLTYDRAVIKPDAARVAAANRGDFSRLPTTRVVVPTSETEPATWKYTVEKPADDWFKPGFAAAGWKEGPAGFGTRGTPGAVVRTEWKTSDIWLRRTITLPDAKWQSPHLCIHHDEDAEVYLNGVLAGRLRGYTTGYEESPLSDEAIAVLKPGENTLAVHCRQTAGGQYIDVGIVDVVPPAPNSTPSKSGANAGAREERHARRTEQLGDYETRALAGFELRIHHDLIRDEPELLRRVLLQLEADLDEIIHFTPPAAADALRTVIFWIEKQGASAMGYGGRGLCCHWSPAWLKQNGLLPEKAGHVEIINPADYLTWRRDQPYMLFHELAHAYHWRLAKLDPEINTVFRAATDAKLYDAVPRNTVPNGQTVRAYALNNDHEYFAELSEACFALNDFFPYTAVQLKAHDPEGYKLVRRLWHLSADEIQKAWKPRESGLARPAQPTPAASPMPSSNVAASNFQASDSNELPNPSFAQPGNKHPMHWRPSTWRGRAEFLYLNDAGRTDAYSAAISSDDGADVAWSCTVSVEPYAKYRLSGWIRTENVQPRDGKGALLNLHGLDIATKVLTGTNDWTRVEVEFETRDNDAVQVNCLFGGWGLATGKAWYDDLALELVSKTDRPAPKIVIDAAKIGAPISKYIYGQFIEHLGRCIYGGIWAEMLEDRKFLHPVGGADSPWKPVGGADAVTMVTQDAFVGAHSPRVTLAGDNQPRGVAQHGLGLRAGKEYVGRIWLAGAEECGPVSVSLIWGAGANERQTIRIAKLASAWTKTPLQFKAGGSTDDGRLEITAAGRGAWRVGPVSLMPADHVQGMRPDTLALLKELDSPVYRWPGGNFVSGYDWNDGLGDPDRRPPRKNPAWQGVEQNDFGLHEFLAFCRLLNTEPYLVVNSGLGDAAAAAEQVQYVNGAPDTPQGRRRAANGRPEPFNVKIWGIGNEMYGDWQLGHMPLADYLRKHNRFADAMRAVDPSLTLIGVGAVGDWSKGMLNQCADHMTWLSEHFYCQERPGVFGHVRQVPAAIAQIADAHRRYQREITALKGKNIQIALDEWNYWYGPHVFGELGTRYFLKDGLGVAAGLHEFARHSDLYVMANYAQTVNVIGCIKTSKTAAAFETTGLALKMYRHHFGVLPATTETGYPLDALAAFSADRKRLTLGVVNTGRKPLDVPVETRGATLAEQGSYWRIAGADPMLYNDPDAPPRVAIEQGSARLTNGALRVEPYSATIFVFDVK